MLEKASLLCFLSCFFNAYGLIELQFLPPFTLESTKTHCFKRSYFKYFEVSHTPGLELYSKATTLILAVFIRTHRQNCSKEKFKCCPINRNMGFKTTD